MKNTVLLAAVLAGALYPSAAEAYKWPLRPRRVTEIGAIPLGNHVTGRDGIVIQKINQMLGISFGDTLLESANDAGEGLVANTLYSTTDLVLLDGVGGGTNFNGTNGRPIEWIPKVDTDRLYNALNANRQPNKRYIVNWPAQPFTNPVDGQQYLTTSKVLCEVNVRCWTVGVGIARTPSFSAQAEPLHVRPGAAPNARTGMPEEFLLFEGDDNLWNAGAVTNLESDGHYLYLYSSVLDEVNPSSPFSAQGRFYVARARLDDGTDAGATPDFLEPGNWRAWNGTGWGALSSRQSILTTLADSAVGGTQPSVEWNEYLHGFQLVYDDMEVRDVFGWKWLPSKLIMMRLADRPEGPWSERTGLYRTPEPELSYTARTHAAVAEQKGRQQFFSYALQGEQTGQAVKLRGLKFRGARGDLAGEAYSDLAVVGASGPTPIAIASASMMANGVNFTVQTPNIPNFSSWASQAGARPVSGDFDGNGYGDIALTGGAGWGTIPVAFNNGNGTFNVTTTAVANFPGFAAQSGVQVVPGDFDGDGRDDIALVGGRNANGTPWNVIWIASSNGNGSFTVVSRSVTNFGSWATHAGAKAVAGDFDGNGRDDIALTGGVGWFTIPVAFSAAGGFNVTNQGVAQFPGWAAQAGAKAVAGDFNNDGYGDIALTGGSGWFTIPVAYSNGSGGFTVSNNAAVDFPGWATQSGAKALAADFNADGCSDIALTGGTGWTTIRVALCHNSSFVISSVPASSFPALAAQSSAKPLGMY